MVISPNTKNHYNLNTQYVQLEKQPRNNNQINTKDATTQPQEFNSFLQEHNFSSFNVLKIFKLNKLVFGLTNPNSKWHIFLILYKNHANLAQFE